MVGPRLTQAQDLPPYLVELLSYVRCIGSDEFGTAQGKDDLAAISKRLECIGLDQEFEIIRREFEGGPLMWIVGEVAILGAVLVIGRPTNLVPVSFATRGLLRSCRSLERIVPGLTITEAYHSTVAV